jgi:hypothetical protein
MLDIIQQVSVSPYVKYFENGLIEKWGLSTYTDPTKPCLFFGVNGQIDLINNHTGFKLLYFVSEHDKWENTIDKKNVYCVQNPYSNIPKDVISKSGWFETRNNKDLVQTPLGDKVFIYLRRPQDEHLMGKIDVNHLQKKINYEIICLSKDPPIEFNEVVNNFYNQCFISVNFTKTSGVTTVCDLGLIGRKTIMNTNLDLKSVVGFKSMNDIIKQIEKESTKINTIQEKIDNYTLNDKWFLIDFWVN